jgi:hypothetical protein
VTEPETFDLVVRGLTRQQIFDAEQNGVPSEASRAAQDALCALAAELRDPAIAHGPAPRRAPPRTTDNPTVPPITLTKPAAAAALGISTDSFERHVQPHIAVIRRGRLRLFPVAELERWAHKNAEKPPTITHTYVLDGAEIYKHSKPTRRDD